MKKYLVALLLIASCSVVSNRTNMSKGCAEGQSNQDNDSTYITEKDVHYPVAAPFNAWFAEVESEEAKSNATIKINKDVAFHIYVSLNYPYSKRKDTINIDRDMANIKNIYKHASYLLTKEGYNQVNDPGKQILNGTFDPSKLINSKDRDGLNAKVGYKGWRILTLCAATGNHIWVKDILFAEDQAGNLLVDINAKDDNGKRAVDYAIEGRVIELFKYIEECEDKKAKIKKNSSTHKFLTYLGIR